MLLKCNFSFQTAFRSHCIYHLLDGCFESFCAIRSWLYLDEGGRYRADCESEWASDRLITVWDKDSSVISGPSHSYRHKHINPTLLREQWHQASYFNTPHCVWRARLSLGIYLLVLIHTYSIVRSISRVLFVRGGLGSARSSWETLDCLIVVLRSSLEMGCVIWKVQFSYKDWDLIPFYWIINVFIYFWLKLFAKLCSVSAWAYLEVSSRLNDCETTANLWSPELIYMTICQCVTVIRFFFIALMNFDALLH